MKSLDHHSIIKVKEMYIENDKCFLVMEKSTGCTLGELISKTRLDDKEVKHLFSKILEAIAYLHEKKICHRDIKPDNIMVSRDLQEIKIIDFNVSANFSAGQLSGRVGNKVWSAPETKQKLFYDDLCDSWSLGLILFYLITGEEPGLTQDF